MPRRTIGSGTDLMEFLYRLAERWQDRKLEKVSCDPGQIIPVAEEWYNSQWGPRDADHSVFMCKVLQRAKETVKIYPNRKIQILGEEDEPGNRDGRPMSFERYHVFHGLWRYIGKPSDLRSNTPGLGEFRKYCRNQKAWTTSIIPRPEQSSG